MRHLYLVHCGYYETEPDAGLYEKHTNFLVVADSLADARERARALPDFRRRRMHVDGLQEIEAVDGFRIEPVEDAKLRGRTITTRLRFGSRTPVRIETEPTGL